MRREDLQIGDWVQFCGAPIQILSLLQTYAEGTLGLCLPYEKIEPIELTPEILEKSGIPKYNKYFSLDATYLSDDDGFLIGVDLINRADKRKGITASNFKTRRTIRYDADFADDKTPFYVHELQHIIKLLGIEKEIVL